ncbi:MAG TPA: winged helix-turn-helix domain-containing protein [Bryobacteraceae bacterium]|jgi:Tol biopolymer transport system component/DNA-binding winged helix-turn-helix (wHTH) protein|nr:winged helix-turn-helix domain-containing protein [Bryobacteraceae bacterium]
MPEIDQQPLTFHFGVFEINPHTRELRKHGVKLKLQDQPLELLLLLLERSGEIVTREKIQKRLWPENTHVDFDNAINSSVRKLRDALGDSSDNPRFIETLARRGYRFIAPVSRPLGAPQRELPSISPIRLVQMPAAESRAPLRKRYVMWIACATLLFSGTVAIVLWQISKSNQSRRETPEPAVPLTGNRGYEGMPAFSPEGARVAFSWRPPGEQVPNIYVKLVGQGEPVRLTRNAASDFTPAWSPDGMWLAFLRARPGFHAAIMMIPALGGHEREVAEVSLGTEELLHDWEATSVPSPFLAWSGDAHWLLALEQNTPHGAFSVARFSVETGAKRVLTLPPNETVGDGGLSVSPDGKTLAFTRTFGLFEKDIFVAPLSEDMLLKGAPIRLTFDNKEIDGLAWTPDGRRLIFSSRRGGRRELWEMSVRRPSEPVRLSAAGDEPHELAVSRQANYLVYTHETADWHIWRMRLDGKTREQPQIFISSTRMEHLGRYSPDGRRIAYQSGRSGSQNIWICNADGSHPVQLTALHNAWAGSPRWSPDGEKITYDSNVTGNWHIYVINAQGGPPLQLTTTNTQDFRASWSRDGRWIYFCSTRTVQPQIWKVPAAGGTAVPVTKNGGGVAFESTDGKDLYYTKDQQLWKMPVAGGNETLVLPSMLDNNYAPVTRGIYFLRGTPTDAMLQLQFLNFATHAIQNIGTVPGPSCDEISVSPDERWLLHGTTSGAGSQLMLIKNFR